VNKSLTRLIVIFFIPIIYLFFELVVVYVREQICLKKASAIVSNQWNHKLEPAIDSQVSGMTYLARGYKEKAACKKAFPFGTPVINLINQRFP
jgi:hypothetical protein